MGRFLKRISLLLIIPILLLLAIYLWTDPYKTLRPFSLIYFDSTNRDYLSSELYLFNSSKHEYDSFVFGSSRGCGINTYHWLKYLPEGSKQFLFQAWSETITGIDQKISYIDERGGKLNNAIILIDIPGSFSKPQLPTQALTIKDPHFSHQSKWIYQSILFYNFIQKPSEWIRVIKGLIHPVCPTIGFDVITNDWDKDYRNLDLNCLPGKDSLDNLSRIAKAAFLKDFGENPSVKIPFSESLIDKSLLEVLNHINDVFLRHKTDFRIIITPGYCYKYPPISSHDLGILQSIFGENNVFDFSGRTDLTSDYNNYSDPNHFGLRIGWLMIEEIYHPRQPES